MKTIVRLTAFALLTIGLFAVLSLACAFAAVRLQFAGNARFPADCAMVFGAAVYGNNRPGPAIVRRVSAAAALYRDGKVRRLLLSGGRGGRGEGTSEAAVMRQQALKMGVNDSDIALEEASRSTLENLLFTRPLAADCHSTVAVSDRYHLARIRLLAHQLGWRSLRTFPAEGELAPHLAARSTLREVLGYVYYAYHVHAFLYLES